MSNIIRLAFGIAISLCLASFSHATDNAVPKISGKTYGEWAALWWQWSESLTPNPASESGDVDCNRGQSGSVWFLAGNDGSLGELPVTRNCTIQKNKLLFFPLVNLNWSNVEGENLTVQDKRELLGDVVNDASFPNVGVTGIYGCQVNATVNGTPVAFSEAPIVRVQSPPFSLGIDDETIADGYWVMLSLPTKHNEHTVHIEGGLCLEGANAAAAFTVDVIYEITISEDND